MTTKTTTLLRYASILVLALVTFISTSCRAPTLLGPQPQILHNQRENTSHFETETLFVAGKGVRRKAQPVFDNTCCGIVWEDFVHRDLCHAAKSKDLIWTVSGGPEYRSFLGMLLDHWKTLEPEQEILVIALDEATSTHACSLGFFSIFWDKEPQSYSRVADAKFQVAAKLASSNRTQLFIELDVLCKYSPLPLMTSFEGDINLIGHGDLQQKINIGMYFIRPSATVVAFFRSLTEILRLSLTQSNYYIEGGVERHFFDQDVFQDCLQVPERNVAYFETKISTVDMLTPCRSQFLQWNMVSNLYVSSFRPPLVYDTTICVHPLDTQPFSSFRTKLTTAKFLGFDPTLKDHDERKTLKTVSGDLVSTEDWNYGFHAKEFHLRFKEQFQRPLATLIALANATNRELVLPRYVRDKIGKTYPIHALLDSRSIEVFANWTFTRSAKEDGIEVELPSTIRYDHAEDQVIEHCRNTSVCSVHGLYKASRYGNSDRLEDIIERIAWCETPPNHQSEFPFAMGSGGFQFPCVKGE